MYDLSLQLSTQAILLLARTALWGKGLKLKNVPCSGSTQAKSVKVDACIKMDPKRKVDWINLCKASW